MTGEEFYTQGGKDEISFRDIVLGHLRKVLQISSEQFRDKTQVTVHGNFSTTQLNEDTRESYIQAVESLAIVLFPYFDERMNKKYEKFDKMVNQYSMDWYSENKKWFDEKFDHVSEPDTMLIFLIEKLREARRVFRELNLLLKRIDYLSTTVYGEGLE